MIKISIIIPVYNVEKYVAACLDSIIQNINKAIEIIVVNDGSKDNSEKVIKEYIKKYPEYIKYFKKKNGGLYSARNEGIKHASGEYLMFVDSDDTLEKNAIDKLIDYINKNSFDILVYQMNSIRSDIKTKIDSFNKNITNPISRYLVGNPSACNKLIKRSLLTDNKLEFINVLYYEDLMFMPTLVNYTKDIKYMDEALYNYYLRDNSITNKKSYNKKMDDIFTIVNSLYEKLNSKYSSEIEFIFIEHLLRNAGIRYLDYEMYDKLSEIIELMKSKYNKWYKNEYYKKYYTLKQKVMCILIYNKKYKTIKLLRG